MWNAPPSDAVVVEGLGTGETVMSVIWVRVDHHSESVVLGGADAVGSSIGVEDMTVGVSDDVGVRVDEDVGVSDDVGI